MLFRVFSDIHLDQDVWRVRATRATLEKISVELWEPKPLVTDDRSVLILAGDIWNATSLSSIREWFRHMAKRFKYVVAVLGNHDYYGYTGECFTQQVDILKHQLKDIHNVYILEKECITIEGVHICGATLWTDMDMNNPIAKLNAIRVTNDIFAIGSMNADKWVMEHEKTLNWLNSVKADIIITHYVPSYKFIDPKFIGSFGNFMFQSNTIERLYANHPDFNFPLFWIFGHTHHAVDEVIDNTRYICNPRGYINEVINTKEHSVYMIES